MTNWMTAAGIAFIAGGLATLISLRSVLFGGGQRRRDRQAAERPGHKAERTADPLADPIEQSPPAASELPHTDRPHTDPANADLANTDLANAALANVGLKNVGLENAELTNPDPEHAEPENTDPENADLESADLENADLENVDLRNADLRNADLEHAGPGKAELTDAELANPGPEPGEDAPPNPAAVTPGDEKSRPISVRRVDRRVDRHGDRAAGWVRPEYQDDPVEPPSGEYWTPVPMNDLDFDLAADDPEPSAKGYGWPIPVERLPSVPDYEPATGFDLVPVPAEPTELVPVWPPDRRVRLPRSWPNRDDLPADNRFLENEPGSPRRKIPDEADHRFRAPAVEPERRRPRPRPRPGPVPDNVYVSRHAAEPPRGTG